MMVNRNVVVQYKRNFLEASPESGNRFKCSPGENDRKEKEYYEADSIVHLRNHFKKRLEWFKQIKFRKKYGYMFRERGQK